MDELKQIGDLDEGWGVNLALLKAQSLTFGINLTKKQRKHFHQSIKYNHFKHPFRYITPKITS